MREGASGSGIGGKEMRRADATMVLEAARGVLGPYYFVGRGPQVKAFVLDISGRGQRTELTSEREEDTQTGIITRTVTEKWGEVQRKTIVVVEDERVIGVEQNFFDPRPRAGFTRVATYAGVRAEQRLAGMQFVQEVYCGPGDARELLFAAGISPEETEMIEKAEKEGRRFRATKTVASDNSAIANLVQLTPPKPESTK